MGNVILVIILISEIFVIGEMAECPDIHNPDICPVEFTYPEE